MLRDYHWPGNVRELRNVVIGVVSLTDKPVLSGEDFARMMPQARERKTSIFDERMSIEDYKRHFIATWQDRYSDTELARMLGISRKTIWENLKRWGLARP